MKSQKLWIGLAAAAVSLAPSAWGQIPYPNSGLPNPTTYTFTATVTGDIDAYFAGSTASYKNQLGLLVNGVAQGGFVLDDHSATVGDMYDFGHVNAGDTLTFVLRVNGNSYVYSDPSMNGSYDFVGANHIYSTPYTAADSANGVDGVDAGVIPEGTYVSFEDLVFPNSDYNYHDENFVFTDVSTTTRTVPDAVCTLSLLGVTLTGLGMLRRRLCA